MLALLQGLMRPPINFFLSQFGTSRHFASHSLISSNQFHDFWTDESINDAKDIRVRQEFIGCQSQEIWIAWAGPNQRDFGTIGQGWTRGDGRERGQVLAIGNAPFVRGRER
jgi:hypothetical protein